MPQAQTSEHWKKTVLESHFQYLPKHFKRAFNSTWGFTVFLNEFAPNATLFSSFFLSSNFNHHLFTPLIWSLYLVFQRTTTILPNKISQPTCTSITVFLFPFCSNLEPTSLLLLYNSSTHTQIWHRIICLALPSIFPFMSELFSWV